MPNPNPISTAHPNTFRSRPSSNSNRSTFPSSSSSWIKAVFWFRRQSGNPDLTEESLDEFNRRNDAADAMRIRRYSPYYKGLNNSDLFVRPPAMAHRISSGRESHRTVASSISTVLISLHEWGSSCFVRKRGPKRSGRSPPHYEASDMNSIASSPSLVARKHLRLRRNEIGSGERMSPNEELAAEQGSPAVRKPLSESFLIPMASSSIGVSAELAQELRKESMVTVKEKEFVWADKYQPKALGNFICYRDKADLLRDMVSQGKCSHFIFEGPPGVGKKTMVWAFLREAFGLEKLETREELREFTLKGEMVTSVQVNMKKSSRHVEINLSELRGYARHILMTLIEEAHSIKKECDHANCRAIVLYQADKLSSDAQHYIRWIMERHKGCNKILFCCSDISKLHPFRSICTVIQLLPPSNDEIVKVLKYIAEQEDIDLPHNLAERITENSKQNLRQAIRSFEASWKLNYPFKEDQVIMTGWEEDISAIARNIIDEQSPKQLYIIRGKLQNLIEHNVSPKFIFTNLVGELKKNLDEQFQSKIDGLYLEYNWDSRFSWEGKQSPVTLYCHQEQMGESIIEPGKKNVNHFMRIEEFTAKFMSFYKKKNFTPPEV